MRLPTFSTLLTLTLSLTPLTIPLMVQSSWGQETVETDIETLPQQAIQQATQGKPLESIETFKQLLTIARQEKNRELEAFSLLGLGFNYNNIGKPQPALEQYNQALVIFRDIKDRSGEATTLNNIGAVYDNIGKPTEAINALEAAVTITLDIRRGLKDNDREAYLAAEGGTAVALVNLLIDQNQAQTAYQWANLATTFELADYTRLINAADKVNNPDAKKAVQDWNKQKQTVETLRQRLQQNFSETLAQQLQQEVAKVNRLAETLSEKYPEVAELFETTPEDITRLQKTIPAGTVVIQPVLLNNNIALFVLTANTLTVKKVPINPQDFEQLIEDYRAILSNRFATGWRSKGGELYDLLIRPIEAEIKQLSPEKIAIIATEKLRYIPFETLYDVTNQQYLLEQYPIHYYTRLSVNSIALQENKPPSNPKVLALGNPKPREPYNLPESENEVNGILNIFPNSEVYTQKDATLSNFKLNASRFSFIHLATHGCFDQEVCCLPNCEEPNHVTLETNTLLFADQNFNLADANELGLSNTELIIISACKTALRQNSTGQEISGMAYILERVGAKAVMASLWVVDDNYTKEIMLEFYRNLNQGMNKTEALRQAKLSYKDNHPVFWSPFILIGSGK
ncbi:CHAT domain-containing tetratricopeptide repeat protein [Crocosphaera sp. XPORK-15E]|uniref:CHAT domain-containing protein n=1 Tax=Crocosphaera sp. XPORK-15E TaxID=3110247 RepID=UPI002B1F4B45|nr:CHAT domain-containing tetratricopeptide repeat protein [Crocosphaera sp. XPORK-15E]MEA5534806.1 CHAT domain-containing tetratricopeptide repeat protein [Crocosphaera sp. XPORK-15E]